jgi:two-component system response regulator DevR
MERLRVFIADEHPIVRLGMKELVEGDGSITVVGSAGSISESLLFLQSHPTDVILVDPTIEGDKGIELIRRLHHLIHPPVSLAVSDASTDQLIEQAFQSGVRGYVTKTVPGPELIKAVWQVYRGEGVLSNCLVTPIVSVLTRLAQQQSIHACGFTDMELAILRQLAAGATNREIAGQEFMSEPTVKRKTHTIYRKLGATDRAGAVSAALRLGLI